MSKLLYILRKSNNYRNSYIEKFMNKYGYNSFSDNILDKHLEEFLLDEGIVIKVADNGIDKFSVVNGPGLRYTIFTQGCIHKCDGCHNPQTHNFENGGEFIEVQRIFDDIKSVSNIIQGVTFSGGDPLFFKNYNGIKKLCEMIKRDCALRNINIWLYTGYSWNEIKYKNIINYVDVVVDGRFMKDLKSYELKFKGSSNQRIIDVKKSITGDEIVEWNN